MSDFKFTNSTQPLPSAADLKGEFVVIANPSTDIWAKPPSTHRFNGPILHKTSPLSSFQRASVHIYGEWITLYDQGGLILVMNGASGSRQWIKAGIEYVDGKAYISVVGKDQWADWSLMPLPASGNEEAGAGARIEMVREKDVSLWIYLVEGGERRRIRQVNWAFVDEGIKECWVGVYAARPAKVGGELAVAFKELEIELSG
ncbi:hypothetical protein RJZ56_004398 [Blastomyces dermatitidis]|uniref:DUF1349 domain-containing protein n=3 Tax=Blastomyces TaxID=229219 RepID=A0A179UZS0_BLAGS|nr:uncharacterized protein BDBG_08033 [Blastomyces gilchristii SLH14081]XP_045271513.1 uncharacterized protein BDCG_00090 [Blastomyces dermatitidis ER-3]EEQ83285.1 hypothetical protein BDCG_00090 [Blastomyces dermatitidis ER-3]EGE81986.1 hypothetical protein BDDG_04929 [Blastomyces dermatitidis ATCC 18188]OAT12719.1 hypothetical protein BDBG_08033 [Blastomyces gilchristii SLH14081]